MRRHVENWVVVLSDGHGGAAGLAGAGGQVGTVGGAGGDGAAQPWAGHTLHQTAHRRVCWALKVHTVEHLQHQPRLKSFFLDVCYSQFVVSHGGPRNWKWGCVVRWPLWTGRSHDQKQGCFGLVFFGFSQSILTHSWLPTCFSRCSAKDMSKRVFHFHC